MKDKVLTVQVREDVLEKWMSGQGNGNSTESTKYFVNFRHYDGTLLHQYTKEDFLKLTEMPVIPTFEGLVNLGWNWNLQEAQDFCASSLMDFPGDFEIGAMYDTEGSVVRIYIEAPEDCDINISLYGVHNIDWGDGLESQYGSYFSGLIIEHTFTKGKYTITISRATKGDPVTFYGNSAPLIFGPAAQYITRVELPINIVFDRMMNYIPESTWGFSYLINLKALLFSYTQGLNQLKLPKNLTHTTVHSGGNGMTKISMNSGTVSLPKNLSAGTLICSNSVVIVPPTASLIKISGEVVYGYNISLVTKPKYFKGSVCDSDVTGFAIDKLVYAKNTSPKTKIQYSEIGELTLIGTVTSNSMSIENSSIRDFHIENAVFSASLVMSNLSVQNVYSNDIGQIIDSGINAENIFIENKPIKRLIIGDEFSSISSFSKARNIIEFASTNLSNIPSSFLSNSIYLTEITLNEGITFIGDYAFSGTSVETLRLPDSVTEIGNSAFAGCQRLTKLIIGKNIQKIRSYVGEYCLALSLLDFSNVNAIPTLSSSYGFYNMSSDLRIVVPDVLYDEWIAATNWSSLTSKIIKKSEWDALQ